MFGPKAQNKEHKELKISPNNFKLVHLLGSDDEKFSVYQDWRCPSDLLLEVFQEYAKISDTRSAKFKEALALNPNLPETIAFKLSQDSSTSVRSISLYNPNHPNFRTKLLESFHNQCLLGLFAGLKNKTIEESLRTGAIISGSSLVSLVRRESKHLPFDRSDDIKDFDFYFHDEKCLKIVINSLIANFIPDDESKDFFEALGVLTLSPNKLGYDIDQLKDHGFLIGKYKLNPDWKLIITNNAITVKPSHGPDYQFILTVCNSDPCKIVEQFDFVHCQSFIRLDNGQFYINPEIHNSMMHKKLIFKGGMNPLSALVRMNKFMARKWRICRMQMIKILAYASANIDFNNPHEVKKLLKGFYLEKGYPEVLDMPVDSIKSIEDLYNWFDELTYKY